MVWPLLSLIVFFLPGFFILKIIYPKKEKISLPLFLSLPVFLSLAAIPVIFFFLSLIKPLPIAFFPCWTILLIICFAAFLLSFKLPWPKIIFLPRKQAIFLMILIFISLILLLAPYLRPHLGPFWSTYHFARGRDIYDRIVVIVGIKQLGLPPQNPEVANQSLNYYYFYHLNAAVLSVMGKIPTELTHLILSGIIMVSSILLSSAFFHFLICLILFLGYGFDFFPMIFSLLKIRPYQYGLDHLDNWTAPFVKDLKVNPLSVWFTWVPQHTLALFLFLILIVIFFDLIKIRKSLKQITLGFLLFAILGSSAYIFLGGLTAIFLFWFFQCFKQRKLLFKDYLFLLIAFLPALALMLPMIIRINTVTLGLYPFNQLPRDHLYDYKFPQLSFFPLSLSLTFFLAVRFLVYFFDLGIIFILALLSWKKAPKSSFYLFTKITLVSSIFLAVLLRSVGTNNDFGYRIAGFSWLACAFLVNSQIRNFWLKVKQKRFLIITLTIIIFSPTLVEQFVFPYQKIDQNFWDMKNFVSNHIAEEAIVQAPLSFEPASVYLLERKTIYSFYGSLFFPDKIKTEKIRQEMKVLFESYQLEEVSQIIKKYKINYLLIRAGDSFSASSAFEKIFTNPEYTIYKTFCINNRNCQ